ncbi:MAG: hypothetical protein AAB801_02565, partial [Patescibacteria group bacterium]
MRRLFLLLLIFLFFGAVLSFKIFAQTNEEYAPDALIVKFVDGTTDGEKEKILSEASGRRERRLSRLNAERVKVPRSKVKEKATLLKKNRKVKYAEPDFVAKKA